MQQHKMQNIVALVSGFLFAVGLGISGMTDPQKVISFLDVFGDWDPSLAFVMGAAVVVYGIGFGLVTARNAPVFAREFELPSLNDLTSRLLIGSAMFGVGWGLGGFCPGPGLAAVASLLPGALVFVLTMVGGMVLFNLYEQATSKATSEPASEPASTPPNQTTAGSGTP